MIPNLIHKEKLPKELPVRMQRKVDEFSEGFEKEQFVRRCFLYVARLQSYRRIKFLFNLRFLFEKDLEKIFKRKEYLHCVQLNYVLRAMLVKSQFFKESDIQLKRTHIWFLAPHQYLQVRMGKGRYLDLDPWSFRFGVEFGDHAHGFESGSILPKR